MRIRDFAVHMSIISVLLLGVSFAFLSDLPNRLMLLMLLSVAQYVIFCIAIFCVAQRISNSSSNYSFVGLVSASFVIKLLMALCFLAGWAQLYQLSNNHHILLYLLVYAIYTSYEVYFLTILAKKTKY